MAGAAAGIAGWSVSSVEPTRVVADGRVLVRATETSSRGPIVGSDRTRALVATVRGIIGSGAVRSRANAETDLPRGIRPVVDVMAGESPLLITVRASADASAVRLHDIDVRARVDAHLRAAAEVFEELTGDRPDTVGVQFVAAGPTSQQPGGRDPVRGGVAAGVGALVGAVFGMGSTRLLEPSRRLSDSTGWPVIRTDGLPALAAHWRADGQPLFDLIGSDEIALDRVMAELPPDLRLRRSVLLAPSDVPEYGVEPRVLVVSATESRATVDSLLTRIEPAAVVVLDR